MKKLFLCLIFVLSFLTYNSSDAAVEINSTFNCSEWTHTEGTHDYPTCTDITFGGCADYNPNDYHTQVTTSANYSGGAGGRGFRLWICDGTNSYTGWCPFDLSSGTQYWIRWYMRYQSGFTWSAQTYDKLFYIDSGAADFVIPGFGYSTWGVASGGDGTGYVGNVAGITWNSLMGGAASDGQWHLFEIYILQNGASGKMRMWIDGVLQTDKTTNMGSGGWGSVEFGANQASPGNGDCMYQDFDDLEIVTSDPGSLCDDGAGGTTYPCIGPYSSGAYIPPTAQGCTMSGTQYK